jgi:TPP-dependent pyruvate/acetoin dehydrogenase alpha subunit
MFRRHLIESKGGSSKSLDAIEHDVQEEIRLAVEFAETSPEPTVDALYADVYADE